MSVASGKSKQDKDDFLTAPDHLSEYGGWKQASGQENFPLRLDIARVIHLVPLLCKAVRF